jgi:nucleotide-binding universal stress UspA family protein
MTVVVVGVDHSEGAKVALRFAIDEARMRSARRAMSEPNSA